jgi:hypothetical protein
MSRLRNGQPFPSLEVPAARGGTISLPDDVAGLVNYLKSL